MTGFYLEQCNYNFTSDNINIFMLLYDYSGSMCDDANAMRKANSAFYNDFSRFEEKGSVAISKGTFTNHDDIRISSFDSVSAFDISYNPSGGTPLYRAIHEAAQCTIDYYNEIVKRLNVTPRITFLVFSDGDDNESYDCRSNAKEAIQSLKALDATTVFVAFRDAKNNGVPEDLEFDCINNIESAQELISCMGTELSKSCKEQSQSATSLKSQFFKSEFFSKAKKDTDSDGAGQAYDDSFFTNL